MISDIRQLRRISLASLPSPLVRLSRLSERLGTGAIYMKRDDLLGRVLGGNKLRKLEYIIPMAQAAGADTLITTGSFESNHVCLTAAVARMLGLSAVVVLIGPANNRKMTLNKKIERRLGVKIRTVEYVDGDAQSRATLSDRVESLVGELTNDLKTRGKRPYFVPAAGCCLEGSYAFVEAFRELHDQMRDIGHSSYSIVLAVGTGSTYAGLWCGVRQTSAEVRIHGISIAWDNQRCTEETIKATERVCTYLSVPVPTRSDIKISDKYVGQGYSKPTAWSQRGIDLAMHTEGLLLDHTYTGKAIGGLVEMLEENQLMDRPIVFWHTGGVAGAIDALIGV